jgi:hypothetical protein
VNNESNAPYDMFGSDGTKYYVNATALATGRHSVRAVYNGFLIGGEYETTAVFHVSLVVQRVALYT